MKLLSKKEKEVQRCRWTSFWLWFNLHTNRFSFELLYFIVMSSLGFCVLRSLDGRTTTFTPTNLDLFFTSVSAATVSSMSTVEMEFFSNTQLVVLTIIMFAGGEVFFSIFVHYIRMFFANLSSKISNKIDPSAGSYHQSGLIELNNIKVASEFVNTKSNNFRSETLVSTTENDLKHESLKFLGVVALFYLVCVQFLGVVSVLTYLNVISSAKTILKHKGLHFLTFSIFTVVSTFTNCGYVPTNENMLIFRKNSGLLLILIVPSLLGNTLFPPALRFLIWITGRFVKKSEARYLLNNSKQIGYHHLRSYQHSLFLLITVLVFIMVQFVLFSTMDWGLESLKGLNVYQKIVGILFQTVNSRHTGELVVDLSTVSGAVMVLFVLMMYLPPYTSFLPVAEESYEQQNKSRRKVMDKLIFSQLTYLAIFIILVCITERKQMVNDPLNFNVLNIVVEVVSGYGNVGFTTGYSCDRRLKQDEACQNKWYGFSGKWSNEGKLVLIIVMIFGRVKKFNMNGGKSWLIL
ncbi:hypothetical protein R6Q59_033263 [Mikania micrantha]